MKRAVFFPGQGSQVVGMGQALSENFASARAVFEEVDDALSQNLSDLMFEGPEDDLKLTANTQPALMAVSMAVVRVLEHDFDCPITRLGTFAAGHSLGEYAALAAAGTLGLADTARLLRVRGNAMQSAVPVGEGGMAALIGADMDQASDIASKAAEQTGEVCVVANDNAPGQIVISGTATAIEVAITLAKEAGLKRALPLPVSAPFHSPLMDPAADVMAEALADVTFSPPALPIISNVQAEAVTEPARLREYLVQQIPGRVRWRESVLYLKDQDVECTVELGAGKVLSGLTKRIDKSLVPLNAGTPQDIEELAKTL